MAIDRTSGFVFIIAVLFSVTGDARVSAEEISPIELIGQPVALCFEIPHPEESWHQLLKSRFAGRLKSFPPVKRFLSGPGYQQWMAIEKYAAQITSQPLSKHLFHLCADSLVIAVYLPEGAAPQGLVIAKSHDADALQQAIDAWGKLEPKHIDQVRNHLGQTYVQRVKAPDSKDVLYYVVLDRILALSDRESLIQQVIEFREVKLGRRSAHAATDPSSGPLSESALYKKARDRLPVDGEAYLYINARVWDKTLQDATRDDLNAHRMRYVWNHISALSLRLRFDEGVALDAIAELDADRLPDGWTRFVSSTRSAGRWHSPFPTTALLAVAGRMDVRPLIGLWLATAPEVTSEEFMRMRRVLQSLLQGHDPIEEALPVLISDMAMHVAVGQNDAVPFEMLASLAVNPAENRDNLTRHPSLANGLDNAFQFGMNFLAGYLAHQNRDGQFRVNSEKVGDATVRWLEGAPHDEPAYTVHEDRLLISNSRASLVRSLSPSPVPTNSVRPSSGRLREFERRFFGETTQLIWLDSVQTREALNEHADWIATSLSRQSPQEKLSISSRLSHISEILQFFDAAFIAARFSDEYIRLTVGLGID